MATSIGGLSYMRTDKLAAQSTPGTSVAAKSLPSFSLDKVAISLAASEIMSISGLTSVNGKTVVDLRAQNNTLTIQDGVYYRLPCGGGVNTIWSTDPMHWEDVKKELGLKTLEPETLGVDNDLMRFVNYLMRGGDGRSSFTQEQRLDFYSRLGIQTNDWVTIDNQSANGRSGRFYLTENGLGYDEEFIESIRLNFSTRDWRKEGCTEDSVLQVAGKEYKMDENGHFNIPKGEPVFWHYIDGDPSKPNIVMPKEMAEAARAKTAKELADRAATAANKDGSDYSKNT
ncbi:MAG: hypothetical protein LBS10_09870 [Gracilibacteraceae bacterium]|jgi:hypothetical protein|nr:hypothetical protein [Gracilibacteraceae bacterium]